MFTGLGCSITDHSTMWTNITRRHCVITFVVVLVTVNMSLYCYETVFTPEFLPITLPDATYSYRQMPWYSSGSVPRLLSMSQHETFIDLLYAIDLIFEKENFTYVLAYGSLLGSYMMHDILPWDDDVDLLSPLHYKEGIMKVLGDKNKLNQLTPPPTNASRWFNFTSIQYTEYDQGTGEIFVKIYLEHSPHAGNYAWKWPFVDVVFYEENQTHVWSRHDSRKSRIYIAREDFYPFHRRPLGSLWLYSPHNPSAFFTVKYGNELSCRSHSWNHQKENAHTRRYGAPCQSLESYYPFVHRKRFNKGTSRSPTIVRESLKINNRILYYVDIEEPTNKRFDFESLI